MDTPEDFMREWREQGLDNKMEMTPKYDPAREMGGYTEPDSMLTQSELMPIDVLHSMREFDRRPGSPDAISSPERYEALKNHIAQHGITSPVWIDWNPKTNEAHVGEGNHRIAAARDLGMTHLPAVVYQSPRKSQGYSLPAPSPIEPDQYGYIPSYIKPSQLGFDALPWEGAQPYKTAATKWKPKNPTWRYRRGQVSQINDTNIAQHNNYYYPNDEQFTEGELKHDSDMDEYLNHENPMGFLRAHLSQLAREHGIRSWNVQSSRHPNWGVAHSDRHSITTGPITSRADYLMGLHELGHLVGGREEMHDAEGAPADQPYWEHSDPMKRYRMLDYTQQYKPVNHDYDPEWGGYPTFDDPSFQHAPAWEHAPKEMEDSGIDPETLEALGLPREMAEPSGVSTSPFDYDENKLETEARAWEWALQHSKVHYTAPLLHQTMGALMTYADPREIAHFSPTAKRIFEEHHGFGGSEGRYPLPEGGEGVTEPWTEWKSDRNPGQPFYPQNNFDRDNYQREMARRTQDFNNRQVANEQQWQRMEPHPYNRNFMVDPSDGSVHPITPEQRAYYEDKMPSKLAKETPRQFQRRVQEIQEQYPDKSEVVHQFPDGSTVRKLRTVGDVARTGEIMRNCWQNAAATGNSREPLLNIGRREYMTMNDPNGIPHTAFHYDEPQGYAKALDSMGEKIIPQDTHHIYQALGIRDRALQPEHVQMLHDWADSLGGPVHWGYVKIGEEPETVRGQISEPRAAATGADHAGAMVAIYPPPEVAEQLAVKNGEPADQLHITLAYFNDSASDREDESWDDVGEVVAKIAKEHGPLEIKIGGLARFDSDKDVEPVVGTVDAPGLAELHIALKEAMEPFGGLNDEHGWNPHLTFAYVPKDEENPEADIPVEWKATEITLVVGGVKTPYKLSEGSRKDSQRLTAWLHGIGLAASTIYRTAAYEDSVKAVQSVLTPDLLHKDYRDNPQAHCYAASEALYHMLGGAGAGFRPMHIPHEGASHWFLSGPNGEVIDATHGQFEQPVPYDQARGKGFLTAQPSKRAQEIMRRVQAKTAWYVSDKEYATHVPFVVIPGEGYVMGNPGEDHRPLEEQLVKAGYRQGDWTQGRVNNGVMGGEPFHEVVPRALFEAGGPRSLVEPGDDMIDRIKADAAERLRGHDFRTSDYHEEQHPRGHGGKWVAKHDQHEVKVHDEKGKHKSTIKRCRHCGTLYERQTKHQGRIGCPTCGLDPERHLRAARYAVAGDPVDAVATSLGWTPARTTTNGHTMYGWSDELGNNHLVTAGHHHVPERQARYARTQMTACMNGNCAHPKTNIGAQMVDEPGAPVIHRNQEVQYGNGHWWVMDIDGELAHIYDEKGAEDIVPVRQLRAAGWHVASDNCLYCNTPLVRSPNHPTWKVCPNCEPQMIKAIQPDRRGEPSRPGPITGGWHIADDDLAERVQDFNEGDHPDTDPDYVFVYYMGKLEMQPYPTSFTTMADNLLKSHGYDVLNYDDKLDTGVDPEMVTGEAWDGDNVSFCIKQLADPKRVEEAKDAVRQVLNEKVPEEAQPTHSSGWTSRPILAG